MNRNLLDPHNLLRPVLPIHLHGLHLVQCLQALIPNDLPKHRVQPIQVRCFIERNEELRPVRARTLVRHGHDPAAAVFQRRQYLVVEGAAPDGLAALGVVGCGRCGGARLSHEFGDEPVEGRFVVVAGCTKGEEILGWLARQRGWEGIRDAYLCGLGHALAEHLDLDVAEGSM